MPNRIIKESICTSDNLDTLSWFEEVCFYRLIVNVDDFGRIDARPAILRSRLFPLKSVTDKQIENALKSLRSAAMIDIYIVDGHSYLQIRKWEQHQTIRAKRSKYPAPESSLQADESNCKQMQADVHVIQSESESNPNPNPNPSVSPAQKSDFERFWEVYPRRENRKDAEKAFDKALKTHKGLTVDVLIAAVEQQKKSAQWQDKQFIPHPATWLNGERWENEVMTAPQKEGFQRRERSTQADVDHLKTLYDKVKGAK